MRALFELMASQHGVASTAQARAVGVTARVRQRMLRDGTLATPCPGVLVIGGMPSNFHQRAMTAALLAGVDAISHGAAARLHGLDGFDAHEHVDVLGRPGARIPRHPGVTVHRTRADLAGHVVDVAGIPVLSVPATLALLAPVAGVARTALALDSALRLGVRADELRAVGAAFRRRGRSGPPALLRLLAERTEQRLPRSWFQRIASGVLAAVGIRLVDDHPVRDRSGVVLAELALADPARRVGVGSRQTQWHTAAASLHRDARRRALLRQLGWEVVDVGWGDLRQPDRVIAELTSLLRSRTPSRGP